MTLSTIRLGELMLRRGGSVDPAKHKDEEFDLYSIPAFDKGASELVMGRDIGSSKQQLEQNDILLSKIVPHIRRAWVVGAPRGRRQIGSGEWIVFRSKAINSRYLSHVLVGDPFHKAFMQTVSGVGGSLLRARPAQVAEIQIPLPPLDEQKRIAAILDAADALRAKRRQSIAQLDALIQSTFLDLFGDPVTNPMGWEVKPLEELCSFLSGYAWKASAFNSDQKGNPVIRIQNVGTQSTDFIFTTENPIDRFWIKRGDLLLSLSGSFRLAAWNGPPALLNQRIVKLTPQKSLSVSYFQAALSRQLGAIESMGRHALVNNVALSDLKQVRLILPPLPLQQKFAAIVESIERQKTTQRAHLTELDTLFAALQHRAFRGEL
jgi:type I restriction enzyme S subunit